MNEALGFVGVLLPLFLVVVFLDRLEERTREREALREVVTRLSPILVEISRQMSEAMLAFRLSAQAAASIIAEVSKSFPTIRSSA